MFSDDGTIINREKLNLGLDHPDGGDHRRVLSSHCDQQGLNTPQTQPQESQNVTEKMVDKMVVPFGPKQSKQAEGGGK